MDATFSAGDLIEEDAVLPTDVLIKDIFSRLRRTSGSERRVRCFSMIEDTMADTENDKTDSALPPDNRRRHPSLRRSLSHETTLKRRKRNDVRQSLNEQSLCAEWASYTPEEREILKFVILKADADGQCSCDGRRRTAKKPSKLQRLRLKKPKIFSRNQDNEVVNAEKEKINNNKGSSKFPNFIRRFVECSSQKSSLQSPRMNRRQSGLEKKHGLPLRELNGDRAIRRPSGNSPLHAMIRDEIQRSTSNCCLSASSFSVVEEVEKARIEYSSRKDKMPRRASDAQNRRNCKERVKLFRANSARQVRSNNREENETFFEIFEKFRKNPMTLVDDTELQY